MWTAPVMASVALAASTLANARGAAPAANAGRVGGSGGGGGAAYDERPLRPAAKQGPSATTAATAATATVPAPPLVGGQSREPSTLEPLPGPRQVSSPSRRRRRLRHSCALPPSSQLSPSKDVPLVVLLGRVGRQDEHGAA